MFVLFFITMFLLFSHALFLSFSPTFIIFASTRQWEYNFDAQERMKYIRNGKYVQVDGGHHVHMGKRREQKLLVPIFLRLISRKKNQKNQTNK